MFVPIDEDGLDGQLGRCVVLHRAVGPHAVSVGTREHL